PSQQRGLLLPQARRRGPGGEPQPGNPGGAAAPEPAPRRRGAARRLPGRTEPHASSGPARRGGQVTAVVGTQGSFRRPLRVASCLEKLCSGPLCPSRGLSASDVPGHLGCAENVTGFPDFSADFLIFPRGDGDRKLSASPFQGWPSPSI